MVIKYTNSYHSKAFQNLPKIGIFGLKTNHLAILVYVSSSLGRFENKNIFFYYEKRSSQLQRWRYT
jgi:hypothetical protein